MHSKLPRLLLSITLMCWSPSNAFSPTTEGRSGFLLSRWAKEETKSETEWGVSYIGGDPCGSKYNTDPHAMEISKPGMPDDMKARIQKLAEEKLRKQQEKETEGQLKLLA